MKIKTISLNSSGSLVAKVTFLKEFECNGAKQWAEKLKEECLQKLINDKYKKYENINSVIGEVQETFEIGFRLSNIQFLSTSYQAIAFSLTFPEYQLLYEFIVQECQKKYSCSLAEAVEMID